MTLTTMVLITTSNQMVQLGAGAGTDTVKLLNKTTLKKQQLLAT